MKWLYRVHKWLAVVAVLATVGWFASGLLMVTPGRWLRLTPAMATGSDAEAVLTGAPQFEEATVPIPSAIMAVRSHVGQPVRIVSVRLRRLPGRVAYEVTTRSHGTHLIDAVSGELFTIDENLARQIAASAAGTQDGLGPAARMTRNTSDCFGRLPAYRVALEDGNGTVFCINAATGDLQYSDRLGRRLRVIAVWHNFGPLFRLLPAKVVRVLMFGFALTGTLMSLAGALILLVQLRRWVMRIPANEARVA